MKFTSNAKERANALESFDKKLRQELQKLVNNTVVYLQGQAQTEAPVKTGFLRNSHQFRI